MYQRRERERERVCVCKNGKKKKKKRKGKEGKKRQCGKRKKRRSKKSSSRETDTPIAASNEVAIKLIAADLIQRHFSPAESGFHGAEAEATRFIFNVAAARSSLPKFHDFFLSYAEQGTRVKQRERIRGGERENSALLLVIRFPTELALKQ